MEETCVVVVDEAQNLSWELLEEIRLLTNLETSSEKLLQIVLSGQPELEEKLRPSQCAAATSTSFAVVPHPGPDRDPDPRLCRRAPEDIRSKLAPLLA